MVLMFPEIKMEKKAQERTGVGLASKRKKRKKKHSLVSFFPFQIGGLGSQVATCSFIHLQKKQSQKLSQEVAYEERPGKIVSKLLYRDNVIVRNGVELMCTSGLVSKVFF